MLTFHWFFIFLSLVLFCLFIFLLPSNQNIIQGGLLYVFLFVMAVFYFVCSLMFDCQWKGVKLKILIPFFSYSIQICFRAFSRQPKWWIKFLGLCFIIRTKKHKGKTREWLRPFDSGEKSVLFVHFFLHYHTLRSKCCCFLIYLFLRYYFFFLYNINT